MRRPSVLWPLTLPFLLVLVVLFLVLLGLVQVGALVYVYERIGIDREWLFALLALSIVGSVVNLPLLRLRDQVVVGPRIVRVYGIPYLVPEQHQRRQTVVAVNVGGALVPAGLAAYLIVHGGLGRQALLAIGVVSVVCFVLARPVRGVGIVLPGLVPAVVAALAALMIDEAVAPALAYVAGVLGTLIGADLLNLPRIRRLGAPVASIGGAGTFDGIFLSGLIAVLIASL
jgi:uncharacterized membrane protein